jgi:tetratricopeptide (TPR) repeat protein
MAAGLLALQAGGAEAQSPAEQQAACRDEALNAARRIAACSVAIEQAGDADVRSEAYIQRGVLLEQAGERGAAVSDYSEAIKIDPKYPIAYFNRGNAYEQLGQSDLAIADYTEAIKLDPTEPDFFNNRGQSYDSRGEHDRAIADYTEAIRLDGASARPLYNRSLSFANKGDFRRAIADLDAAIKLAPDDVDLYVARGAAQEELGNPDAARANYRQVLRIDPGNEDALEGLNRLGGN